jgi:uncharacterized protein (TIGR02145 family)
MKVTSIIIAGIISVSLFSCKTEDIILHGDITGLVTDASTGEPVEAASVEIIQSGDSTFTGSDGTYLFRNINPGQYEIQASKFTYALYKRNVTVASAETTKEIDFPLIGIPEPDPSASFLDFSVDSTVLSFSISNNGKGKFTYLLTPSQPSWIGVSPAYGDITNETDNITVTINKTGLSESTHKEFIKVTSFSGLVPLADIIIPVYLNGAMDGDGNYYKVVRIGTQTWMAENLKTTRYNDGTAIPLVEGKTAWNISNTPGYCWYNDIPTYKDTYGALYNWYAVNTGKLCPTGWHVPTNTEWTTLTDYLGGTGTASGKLKETGTTHWLVPNDGTNESGFTALPGGYRNSDGFLGPYGPTIGTFGAWWSSTEYLTVYANDRWVTYNTGYVTVGYDDKLNGLSVRCLKD